MRNIWIQYLESIISPVLSAAAADSLKSKMPIHRKDSTSFQYLEAIGRIVCGIGPWLNLPKDESEESKKREKYRGLTIKAISNLVDPNANDYVDFSKGSQPLVDTAYLVQGFLRAPNLWNAMQPQAQERLLNEIKKTRKIRPPKNNWLLFASIIETFLLEYDKEYNQKRLYRGLKKFIVDFYCGDGMYGDGRDLSIDYYNSFVIQPMLIDILNIMRKHKLKDSNKYFNKCVLRYKRYSEIQERMISPEGAYPVLGRTLICRFGVFHALAQAALLNLLPDNIYPSQVRCALNAVLMRHLKNPNNFDSNGFMTIGFNGRQEKMAENYVSSGSTYHCCTIFLPLGLSPQHAFWLDKNRKWTALKAFEGDSFEPDYAYHEQHIRKQKIIFLGYKLQSGMRKLKNIFSTND